MRYSAAAAPTVTQGFCTALGSHRRQLRYWVSLGMAGPMSSGEGKPELAVNQHGATVADALNGFISHAADGLAHDVRLDIATAYFNVGGYSLLAESLDKLAAVRLLLGADPVPPERRDERLAAYEGRIASHTGSGGGQSPDPALGFAPDTAAPGLDHPDYYDILVTTDVLAEGVNLQQARHIINYDLPWNPMRLVQRHGRIDRIGSKHREVFIRCVFPDTRLDELLGLEERLNRKIAQAAASIGVGDVIPGQQRRLDRSFSETREEIERLRAEDASIFERGGTEMGAQSGEEFRAELRRAMEDPETARVVRLLPWGTGSGMAAAAGKESGHVFCARVGDDPSPLFRFVGDTGEIHGDTLKCLWRARPARGFDTPRVLDGTATAEAFDAWTAAQADIVARWNHFSDKANLEPKIPAALRQAADIVRSHPPPTKTDDEIGTAIDALQAPYTERITRLVRHALRSAPTPAEQAVAILRVIEEQGLQPQPVPEPLPEITTDDVHLVCWQALTA